MSSNIDSFQFVSFVQINIQNQITIQNYLCDISVLNDDFEERVSKLIQSSLFFWWVFFPSKNITAIAFDLNVQLSTCESRTREMNILSSEFQDRILFLSSIFIILQKNLLLLSYIFIFLNLDLIIYININNFLLYHNNNYDSKRQFINRG